MGNSVVYIKPYDAEIEYLESTGTQWIDTDFRPDSMTTSFELDISFEGQFVMTKRNIIKTSVAESSTQKFHINFGASAGQENKIFLWFGREYDGTTSGYFALDNVALTRDIFSYSQGIVSYNGKSANLNNSSYPPIAGRREGTMLILKDFDCYNARLYGAKIWDNNVLIRDFIPVRIGQIGYLYDKVTKQLFANKGTGQFILGNDVSNAVIPQQRCVLYFGNQRSVGYERIYEEYEWLRITLPKTSNVYKYVPINSDTFGLTIIIESGYNVGILDTNKYLYYSANSTNTMIGVWNTYDSVDEKFTSVGSSQMIFESSNTDFQINGVSITKYGFPVKRLMYYSKSADLSELISSITVDGSVRYVPCKLTHSIPASMDANGIARPAGTCGMWDKVNDKFYGNVANSGSFSVSN